MTRIFPFLLLLVACAPSVPAQPNWVDDVGPILKANCARCHGTPANGAAPLTFRLDRVGDDLGRQSGKYGSLTMAGFVAERAAVVGDMPPNGPELTDRQKEILIRWAAAPAPGTGNQRPTMTLTSPLVDSNTSVALRYFIEDGDRDGVVGSLFVGGIAITNALHAGRGSATIDTGQFATGTYPVTAEIDDGFPGTPALIDLGTLNVTNATAAPRFEVVSPAADDILIASESPQIVITSNDPNIATWTVTIDAFNGATSVNMVMDQAIGAPIPFDTIPLPSAPAPRDWRRWRLRVTVTDAGGQTRTVITEPFIVSEAVSAGYTWDNDINSIIENRCRACHTDYVPFNLSLYSDVAPSRGLVWRRAVQTREMPPQSAESFIHAFVDSSYATITDAERDMLGNWLLTGAPQ